jgi:DNA-binding MarR family transcriptional regulator
VTRTSSPADKRRIEISLTPEGQKLLEGAPSTIQTQLVLALKQMSREDQESLADLLERWLTTAKIDLAAPPMLGESEQI